jgi:hypothetical protein
MVLRGFVRTAARKRMGVERGSEEAYKVDTYL